MGSPKPSEAAARFFWSLPRLIAWHVVWSRELAGQFVFASTMTNADLRAIPELAPAPNSGVANSGIYVIQPGEYGLTGKVLKRISVANGDSTRTKVLQDLISQYKPQQKSHRQHVRQGVQFGLKWESKVPITDAMSLKATNRIWDEQ